MNDLRTAAQQAEPVAWLRVIDEAMVVHHLGVADPTDDYETAKRKMNTLLCMAQDIGADFAKQAEPVQPVEATEDRRCPHGIRHPHPCRECEDGEQQAETVAFDPAVAMRLADEYAEAAHQFHHRVDEARAKLAAYLGIKEKA